MAPKAGLHDSRVEAAAEEATGGKGVQSPREHFGKHDLKWAGKGDVGWAGSEMRAAAGAHS